MKLCPQCQKNQAQIHETYGVLFCKSCQKKEALPKLGPEFVPDRIKQDRNENYASTIQAYRGNTLSKEYLKFYGTKFIKPSKQDIKNAKWCWKDTPNWENRDKTK